ncbi:helix-turn-helix domain-containing protein [Streptomyces telluris]|uniref:Helix-turn-helix transcriptional regulator n=1 Tax=Streptomyces telluris TaxID=2720021 RepID=A0A9X2RMU0_9ACTN|nr:helix-turn-helix transcriptional regulator [Streptomyces telluris]MCQ8769335.1 helix-turn-helix transcriptional regulator [Streptomyces telluris]NJP80080.1 helix-turn-helix domain-containing protein [Streptomyces telluris]
MAPRNNPTARQVRLGTELRRMREQAGMKASEAARLLGVSPMQMSHMETARLGVGKERLRTLAAQYGCADAAYVDALVAMTGRRGPEWWQKFRNSVPPEALDLAALEWYAKSIQGLQTVHVPGLLQTTAYTRALFSYLSPGTMPADLDAEVEFRKRRRAVLERDDPPPYSAIIHEAALRVLVGDRDVAREQLNALLEQSEQPGVTIRVVPFSAERFAGMGYSMLYATGPVPQLDTVQIDHVHGSVFLDTEEQLAHYRDRWRTVERSALGPGETRNVIHRVAREL